MLKELDGFRAVAVSMVVLFHLGFYTSAIPGLNEVVGAGYLGVQIFFILSSFLLARQYLLYYPQSADKKEYTFNFFKKRILRILPLYLFSSIILSIPVYKQLDLSLLNVVQYLLFIKDNLQVNVVIWSLFVEVRFYILLPILMAGMFYLSGYKRAAMYVIPVVVILYSYLYRYLELTINTRDAASAERLYSSLSANIDCLGLGIIAAMIYERYKQTVLKSTIVITVTCLLLACIFGIMYIQYHKLHTIINKVLVPLNNVLWTAAIVVVMLGKTTFFNKILSSKVAVYISMLSYSIYLWHLPIRLACVQLLHNLLKNGNEKYIMLSQFVLTILLTWLVSAISYRYVEKPFLKKKMA